MRRRPDRITRRAILRLGQFNPSSERDDAFRRMIRQIPKGKVATYGQVAAAAGYPLYHRQVARILRNCGDSLPWQRVVGSGGRIKLRGGMGLEQRTRLETEGVRFRGKSIDLAVHQHVFRPWLE